jgi:hypothetical protein
MRAGLELARRGYLLDVVAVEAPGVRPSKP